MQCSETCGNSGIMQRRAICVDQNSRPIDEKLCERAAREITEKECNRIPCPKWVYSAWSEVSYKLNNVASSFILNFFFT